jgi:3-mercaptopyruvate sulfurtransferase SseA
MDEMKEAAPVKPDNGVVSWVSTEWLADHLDKIPFVIVDCRQQTHAYFHEHIPGAIYVHEGLLRTHIGKNPLQTANPYQHQQISRVMVWNSHWLHIPLHGLGAGTC